MKKPIFIIGCPRSGTTLTLKILALHEQLSWVSNYVNRVPHKPSLSAFNRIYSLPLFGRRLYLAATRNRIAQKNLPFPVEPWKFWNSYLSSFQWVRGGNTCPRRRTSEDITSEEVGGIRKAIDSIQHAQGKDRFLSKYTDFPRMKYLTRAFPDAVFVHVVRDGRAVAASYHEKVESGDFGTWDEREWWMRGWPAEWRKEWQDQFGTPLSFLAFQWKFFVREILEEAQFIPPEQYLEIPYRNMVRAPIETFNKVLDFCELKRSRNVEWYLDSIAVRNMNQKWKERYSDSDRNDLERAIHEPDLRKLLDE